MVGVHLDRGMRDAHDAKIRSQKTFETMPRRPEKMRRNAEQARKRMENPRKVYRARRIGSSGSRRFDRFPATCAPLGPLGPSSAFTIPHPTRTDGQLFPRLFLSDIPFLTSGSTFNRSRSFLDIHSSSCRSAKPIRPELSIWLQENLLMWPRKS
jgi:hypothetical protein